jgi:hypothetical protein
MGRDHTKRHLGSAAELASSVGLAETRLTQSSPSAFALRLRRIASAR